MESNDQTSPSSPESSATEPKSLSAENIAREEAERAAAEKEAAQRVAEQSTAQSAITNAQAAVTKAVNAVADGAAPTAAVEKATQAVGRAVAAAQGDGADSQTKERAKQLNLVFHHFAKDARSYYFSDRPDSDRSWIVGPRIKDDERLYAALRRFDDLLRANYPQQAPGSATAGEGAPHAEPIAGVGPSVSPQKFEASTVRLRSGVTWADLQRIRRSRSIYASPGSGGVYATAIARAEPALGAGSLADAMQLTEKGLAVDFGWGVRRVFETKTDLAQCARELADALDERGFDISGAGGNPNCKLHSISERGISDPSGKLIVSAAALASRSGGPAPIDAGEYEGAADRHVDDAYASEPANGGESDDGAPSGNEQSGADAPAPARAPKPPLSPAQHAVIRECLEAVARADDGATKADNVGFSAEHANRSKTGFAQLLLARDPWTDKEARAGRILVLKYHRQVPPKLKGEALHGLDGKLLKPEHFSAAFLHRYCGWEAPVAELAKTPEQASSATDSPAKETASDSPAASANTEPVMAVPETNANSGTGEAEAAAAVAVVEPETAPEKQTEPEPAIQHFAKSPTGRAILSMAGAERLENTLRERAPEICSEIARRVGQEFDPNRLVNVMVKTIDGGGSVRVTYALNVRGAPKHLKSVVVSVSISQKSGMFIAGAETYATLTGNEAAASKAGVLVDFCNQSTGPVPPEMLPDAAPGPKESANGSQVNREFFELTGEQMRAIQTALAIIDRNSTSDPKSGGFAPEHRDIGHALASKPELANEEALVARALVERYSEQVQEQDLAVFRAAVAGFPGKYTKQADLDPGVMRAHMGWAPSGEAEARAVEGDLPHPSDLETAPLLEGTDQGAPVGAEPPLDEPGEVRSFVRHPLEMVAGPHSLELRNSPMVVVGVIPLQVSPAQHRALTELADGREMRMHSYRMDQDTLVICDVEFRGERPEHVHLENIVEGASRSAGVPANPEVLDGAEAALQKSVDGLAAGTPAPAAAEAPAPMIDPSPAHSGEPALSPDEEGVMGDTSIKTLPDGSKVRTVRREVLHPEIGERRAPTRAPSGPSI